MKIDTCCDISSVANVPPKTSPKYLLRSPVSIRSAIQFIDAPHLSEPALHLTSSASPLCLRPIARRVPNDSAHALASCKTQPARDLQRKIREGLPRLPKDTVPIVRHMPNSRHYLGREMPSFFIFDWSVVRFIARRAAAPLEPPNTQPASRRTLSMWSLSASARLPGLRGRT